MTERITAPRRVKAAVRRAEILRLRMSGASYQAIAEQLGLRSLASVSKTLTDALAYIKTENVETVRALELERLDRLQMSAWLVALGYTDKDGTYHAPELEAMHVVLRIMDRRARLLGLDKDILLPAPPAANQAQDNALVPVQQSERAQTIIQVLMKSGAMTVTPDGTVVFTTLTEGSNNVPGLDAAPGGADPAPERMDTAPASPAASSVPTPTAP